MHREIGSNFWFNKNIKPLDKELTFDFLCVEYVDMALLSTGRSAISYALKHIEPHINKKRALLPSFTCHTVIQPFLDAGYEVNYYSVDKRLVCECAELLRCVDYINHQFCFYMDTGFNTLEAFKRNYCRNKSKRDICYRRFNSNTLFGICTSRCRFLYR